MQGPAGKSSTALYRGMKSGDSSTVYITDHVKAQLAASRRRVKIIINLYGLSIIVF